MVVLSIVFFAVQTSKSQEFEASQVPFPPGPLELALDENGIPLGCMVIEEDIIVPEDFFFPDAPFATNLWPNGIVPFQFDANVSGPRQGAMLAAMDVWENVANVDFRPRDGETNHIHIRNSTGNSSSIGMRNGQQIVNIASWGNRFIMVHELGHALGYWHEQSRWDRGNFVQIIWANIAAGMANNFNVRSVPGGEYGPYDFDSVMHYGQCSFSNCSNLCPNDPTCPNGGRTIVVLPPNQAWQNLIGQRTHISTWDGRIMSFLYPEDDWRFLDSQCGNRGVQCWVQFDCIELGNFFCPYVADFPDAVDQTPSGGTLWILADDTYSTGGTLSKPMTIRAAVGATLTS